MKLNTTRRLLGAIMTAALVVSATYSFANGPNASQTTANVQSMSLTTHASPGSLDIGTIGQNTIACTALPTLTEGGVLVGTELVAINNLGVQAAASVAININSIAKVAGNNDVAPTFTERTRGDVILHLQSAANVAYVPQDLGTAAIQNVTTTATTISAAVSTVTQNDTRVANNTAKARPNIDEGAEYEFIFEIAGTDATGFARLMG